MTKEELLIPRYKVIAQYPMSSHCTGDILTITGTAMFVKGKCEWLDKYPHQKANCPPPKKNTKHLFCSPLTI